MRISPIQGVIVACGTVLGGLIGRYYVGVQGIPLGAVLGLVISIFIIHVIKKIIAFKIRDLVGTAAGIASGVLLSSYAYNLLPVSFPTLPMEFMFRLFLAVVFGYMGGLVGAKIADSIASAPTRTPFRLRGAKILDTSAIIDGRIADVCETGFFEYNLIVPSFVLKELQRIADSTDPLVRNRGRRGFEVLKRLREIKHIRVRIEDIDFPEIKEVDDKLIHFAKKYRLKIITTDYNLNQVARLQGVEVLNINDLAKALRPVVLPGETLEVFLIKRGKEPGQGVGYLDDGTMVVVEDGLPHIGKRVRIMVTSLLQSSTGRIIFGRIEEILEGKGDQSVRGDQHGARKRYRD